MDWQENERLIIDTVQYHLCTHSHARSDQCLKHATPHVLNVVQSMSYVSIPNSTLQLGRSIQEFVVKSDAFSLAVPVCIIWIPCTQ